MIYILSMVVVLYVFVCIKYIDKSIDFSPILGEPVDLDRRKLLKAYKRDKAFRYYIDWLIEESLTSDVLWTHRGYLYWMNEWSNYIFYNSKTGKHYLDLYRKIKEIDKYKCIIPYSDNYMFRLDSIENVELFYKKIHSYNKEEPFTVFISDLESYAKDLRLKFNPLVFRKNYE